MEALQQSMSTTQASMEKRMAVVEETQEGTLDKMLANPHAAPFPDELIAQIRLEVDRALPKEEQLMGSAAIPGVTTADWEQYKVDMAEHLRKILQEDRQRIAELWEKALETPGRWPSWEDIDKATEDMKKKYCNNWKPILKQPTNGEQT